MVFAIERWMLSRTVALWVAIAFVGAETTSVARATSLREAVERTVYEHPAIEAARANRRATEYELRQSEGRRLPRIDLDADTGAEKIDQPLGLSPLFNNEWQNRRQANLVVSQILFDGWERSNDIYRNAARVNSAAARVLARADALALDAVEAFIDVQRHRRVLEIARKNVVRHQQLLGRARDQVKGGKVPESEVTQVRERIAAAEEVVERVRQSLLEADAKYLKVIGEQPRALDPAPKPRNLILSRSVLIDLGLTDHPLMRAANADAEAARYAREQTYAGDYPSVSLEMRGMAGEDLGGTPGRDNELVGKVVLRWNLFEGFITRHRQLEASERLAQSLAERDDRARSIVEEINRALAAYQTGLKRLEALQKQAESAREVVAAFEVEYTLSKRSLLDVLTAENTSFNARIQSVSTDAVNLVSAYRLLAATGRILTEFGIAAPPEGVNPAPLTFRSDFGRGSLLEPLR